MKGIWKIRATVALLVAVMTGIASAGSARAENLDLYLVVDDALLVASADYLDDGDIFILRDEFADGYGPTLTLQMFISGSWVSLASMTNRSGAGKSVQTVWDIKSGSIYRMKLCRTNLPSCAYSGGFTE